MEKRTLRPDGCGWSPSTYGWRAKGEISGVEMLCWPDCSNVLTLTGWIGMKVDKFMHSCPFQMDFSWILVSKNSSESRTAHCPASSQDQLHAEHTFWSVISPHSHHSEHWTEFSKSHESYKHSERSKFQLCLYDVPLVGDLPLL